MNLASKKWLSGVLFGVYLFSAIFSGMPIKVAHAAANSAYTLSGVYAGNGLSAHAITGLGFQPDVVMIKTDNANAAQTVIKTSTMSGTLLTADSAVPPTGLLANDITSFDSDGFTVGNDFRVNAVGFNYYWIAFKAAPGELVVDTYAGDGNASQSFSGLGFQPNYVIVINNSGETSPKHFSSEMTWAHSFFSEAPNLTRILSLDSDGFTVGNAPATNGLGSSYSYIAWGNMAGRMKVDHHTGNSIAGTTITGLGFNPEILWITPEASNLASTWRPAVLTGDNTLSFNIFGQVNNQIQNLIADGFQVGTHPRVNQNGVVYRWVAWAKNVPPTVTPSVLQNGTVGENYSHNLMAAGGSGGYHDWVVSSGALPSELQLNPNTGNIYGTPTVAGNYQFSVTVADSENTVSNPLNFEMTVIDNSVLNVSTDVLASATVNMNYSQNLEAFGGSGVYTLWAISSGALPDGLDIDPATGNIFGVPTMLGTANFAVTVTDSSLVTSLPVNFSIAVNLPPAIVTSSLPPAAVGALYSQNLEATAGSGIYSNWSLSSGSLPDGLNINPATGNIYGEPTATGVSNFSFVVTDSNGVTSAPVSFSINVYASMTAMFEQLNTGSNNFGSSVIILVDPNVLSSDLIGAFTTWVQDLQNDFYRPVIKVNTFVTPEEVRAYLQQQSSLLSPSLEGVILVGNIPYVHLVIDETSIPGGTVVSVPTYEFYQDLDGNFTKADPNFPDAYSTHTGNTENEIWVSVLPFYQDVNTTVQNLVYYLGKNHTYRTQGTSANGYIEIKDTLNAQTLNDYNSFLESMATGAYSWIPTNSVFNVIDLFLQNTVGQPGLTAGYAALAQPNKYAAFALNTHGDSFTAGWLSKSWFENNTLKPLFAFLTGCSSGNPDAATPPVLSELIYNVNSAALIGQGTTALSSGLGTNVDGFYGSNILRGLFDGKNVGEAFRDHLNTPLIAPWSQLPEYQHALLILDGDATLRFPIRSSTPTLATSKNPTILNEAVTFTATVAGANPAPTGTITFKDGANTLATVALDGTGHAQYQISNLSVGGHSITAVYNGDGVYGSTVSVPVNQVVNQKATPTVTPMAYPNPSQVNKNATFYAIVSGSYGTPTGTVNFYDGNTYLGMRTLNVNGQAAFSISTLSAGNHSITVRYNGNATYNVTTSAVLVQVVQ